MHADTNDGTEQETSPSDPSAEFRARISSGTTRPAAPVAPVRIAPGGAEPPGPQGMPASTAASAEPAEPAGRGTSVPVGPSAKLYVPACFFAMTRNVVDAVVLALISFWLEPRRDARGPRTRVADGRYFYFVSSYAEIARKTGLSRNQARRAIDRLTADGLVVRRDASEAEAGEEKWSLIEGHHRRPDPGESCYRLSRQGMLRAFKKHLAKDGELESRRQQIDAFLAAARERNLHAESAACDDGWFRSDVQQLLEQPGYRDPFVTIPPALILHFADPLDAVVFAALVAWKPTLDKHGRDSLTRTLREVADETGIRAVKGRDLHRHSRLQKSLTRLQRDGWITKRDRRSAPNRSYIEIRFTAEGLERFRAATAPRRRQRKLREARLNAPTGPGGSGDRRRRGPCPQHEGSLDGRRRDPDTDCYVWDEAAYDPVLGDFRDPAA